MVTEENEKTARRIFAALNDRDLDTALAYYDPDACFHGWAPETLDVAGYKAAMSELLAAFPDSRFRIEDVIAAGNRIVVRHEVRGTHRGPFQGIAPTNKEVCIDAIVILHLDDGMVEEAWLNADMLGWMQQLGVVPAPGG